MTGGKGFRRCPTRIIVPIDLDRGGAARMGLDEWPGNIPGPAIFVNRQTGVQA